MVSWEKKKEKAKCLRIRYSDEILFSYQLNKEIYGEWWETQSPPVSLLGKYMGQDIHWERKRLC